MASFVRLGIILISLGIVLFSMSCEKHPLGELPEVQREQPDPATVWSEGHSPSGSPAEGSHEAR